jgi:hypothetical protein
VREVARASLRFDGPGRMLAEVRALYELGRLVGYVRRLRATLRG